MTPSFKDFLDYYYNFQSIKDGSVEMAFCVGVLISTICFHMFLKDTEIRKLMIIAIIFNIVNCVLNVCLALDIMFGLTLFQFVVIQSFLFDSIYQAFSFLPVYVVFTKLVPYEVEGSMFALLTGTSAFTTLVYGRLIGVFYNSFFDVTLEDNT